MMRLMSPRSTAPYHTLDSSSRTTSPSTVAPGTTHALECIVGPFFKRAAIPPCPVGSVSGSICIRRLMFDVRYLICILCCTDVVRLDLAGRGDGEGFFNSTDRIGF